MAPCAAPTYKALRLPIKAAFVSMSTFFCASFASEYAIFRYNRPALDAPRAGSSRTLFEVIGDNRLSTIGLIVAGVVVGVGVRTARRQNLGTSQKIMNVRLYGQMAGLAAIAAVVALTAKKESLRDRAVHDIEERNKDASRRLAP